MRCLFYRDKKAQVWVETVIYTLVGLAILGILIVSVRPKIKQMQDESLIEQAMDSLLKINSKIYEASSTKGTRTRFDLKIGGGKFVIDGINDKIYWGIDSSLQYSEENIPIDVGIIKVTTTADDPWYIEMDLFYNFDIKFNGIDETKEFYEGTTPYSVTIENLGAGSSSKITLNFEEI